MKTAFKFDKDTRDRYLVLLDGKPLDRQIKYLEVAERQKYNYYCDRCAGHWNWTPEADAKFEAEWNEIIAMLDELKEKLAES